MDDFNMAGHDPKVDSIMPEQDRDEALTALKRKLERAAEQEQRGELCDGDAFMEQLLARLSEGK